MKKSGGESVELNYEALGERINRIRKEKGITQSVLAERVVIEPSNTSHIERAASKVGLGTLVKIANALECTLSDLLCEASSVNGCPFVFTKNCLSVIKPDIL